jgi:DNA primase
MQGTGAPERYVLERLAKTVNNFVLCFDGDEGGKKAVQQFISAAGSMAQKGDIQVSVAQLPERKDPDEVCRELGPQAFHNLVADAMPWLDWVIDFWAAGLDKTNTAHVTAVERELRALIDGLVSNTVRTHYIDKVARALSQDDKEARKVAKDWGTRSVPVEERQWVIRSEEKTKLVAERRLLRLFVHKPEHRDTLRPLIANVTHPPFQWLCERLQELEACSSVDLTPHSVMAVVVVSEPHFMQQLRRIVQPNVLIDDSPGVLSHLHVILGEVAKPEPHELNSDQLSAF